MSKTIWKYPLKIIDHQALNMPRNAQILCVQVQYVEPCIWALVDSSEPPEERYISMFGTGHRIPSAHSYPYVGTFQINEGDLVFHVFASPSETGAPE